MIAVEKAWRLIDENAFALEQFETRRVTEALGFVLFEPVVSPIHLPPFRQSAMDGFALCNHQHSIYTLVGEVKAGDAPGITLKNGEAVRIFTGAVVPDTATAVVMQEKTKVDGTQLEILGVVEAGQNIRPLGEQVQEGDTALKQGALLTPAALGFLSSIGIQEVKVFKKPTVAIVGTGNELTDLGQPLAKGKIYESNTIMLGTSLCALGCYDPTIYRVADTYEQTVDTIGKALEAHDMVLISGGISVGDYDFVGKALDALSVNPVFYKVNQKPGKPLFFGKKDEKVVFALPGNPAAALTCFYLYVYPAFRRMSGETNFQLQWTLERSASACIKNGNRAQFFKALSAEGKVRILEGQSSAMLQTFALANALVYVPAEVSEITKGTPLKVWHLPN